LLAAAAILKVKSSYVLLYLPAYIKAMCPAKLSLTSAIPDQHTYGYIMKSNSDNIILNLME